MSIPLSRYWFQETSDGFTAEGADRPPVHVRCGSTAFEAWFADEAGETRERFGLFQFGRLLEFVARGLMREWRPQQGWFGAQAWAHQQTARAVARRLRELWLRRVEACDPTVVAVQKAVFAATFGDAPLAHEPALYRQPFLVRDVVAYPAAAIALRNALTLTADLPVNDLLHSAAARKLMAAARALGLMLEMHAHPQREPDVDEQISRLLDWRSLFSDTGRCYRALEQTLAHLPGRIPHRLVCALRHVRLTRQVTNRLELLAILLYSRVHEARIGMVAPLADHAPLLHRATAEQIRTSLGLLSAHLNQPLDARKAAGVEQLVTFLADYPQTHRGSLVELTRRAIAHRQQVDADHLAAVLARYAPATATARPPIPLPDRPGVRFLDTLEAMCAAARQLGDTMPVYVELVRCGRCYLFAVERDGATATVAVGRWEDDWRTEAFPPRGNAAAMWGKRILSRWARNLPPPPEPSPPTLTDDDIPF